MSSEIFYIISLNLELKRKENKMTQEEKAKAYDEKVKKIITLCLEECVHSDIIRDYEKDDALAWLEKQESLKDIIDRYKDSWYNEGKIAGMTEGLTDNEKYQQGWHDALEKQGEWKPDDNVEPTFKVGDWITNGDCKCQIAFIDNRYWYSETCVLGDITSIDKTFHLWTIQDDKDGDVLTYKNDDVEWILIYKNIIPESLEVPQDLLKYHALFTDTDFYDSGIAGMISENYASYFNPATKEQQDILEKAMTASGYEWDAEKKKLKRTEKQGEQKQKIEE